MRVKAIISWALNLRKGAGTQAVARAKELERVMEEGMICENVGMQPLVSKVIRLSQSLT